MERELFIGICESFINLHYNYRDIERVINLDYYISKMEFAMDTLFKSVYTTEGVDNIWWYIFERRDEGSNVMATDSEGNEIMDTLESLYDFVTSCNKLEDSIPLTKDDFKKVMLDWFEVIDMRENLGKCGFSIERPMFEYGSVVCDLLRFNYNISHKEITMLSFFISKSKDIDSRLDELFDELNNNRKNG